MSEKNQDFIHQLIQSTLVCERFRQVQVFSCNLGVYIDANIIYI
jgi:hypothetical protein